MVHLKPKRHNQYAHPFVLVMWFYYLIQLIFIHIILMMQVYYLIQLMFIQIILMIQFYYLIQLISFITI